MGEEGGGEKSKFKVDIIVLCTCNILRGGITCASLLHNTIHRHTTRHTTKTVYRKSNMYVCKATARMANLDSV